MESAQLVSSLCCSDERAATNEQDCGTDPGCFWESTLTSAASALLLKEPALAFICFLCLVAVIAPTRPEERIPLLMGFEPGWVPNWNFARRTALPVRAPSLA